MLGHGIDYKEWSGAWEKKTLTSTTNSGVEFQDLVDRRIEEIFNNQVSLFNLVSHEQNIGKSAYWDARTARNSVAGSNSESGDVTSSYSTRIQFNLPIRINTAVVEVTDFAETAHLSEGANAVGMASLFEQELNDSMVDLLAKPYTDANTKMGINAQIFRDGTGNGSLDMHGLSYWVDDSSSTRSSVTTVAGQTRSSYENLYVASGSFDSTTEALTEADLRAVIESCETEGANRSTMALVTTHALRGKIFDMMSAGERYLTTEAKFGFLTVPLPTFDGIPIYADKDCPSGVSFVLDMATFRLRELKPMHFEPLAKTAMTQKGIVKYFANLICKDVGKNGILYNKS
uniref:Putative capsid protein n=1 Tax=viral metagenome TaxID=1070528 RepID=A0A6M3IJN6_9ZZZZ